MNVKHNSIYELTKHLIYILVFSAMVIKPILSTVTFYTEENYELVDIEPEEESEKEKQEEDNKDKKLEINFRHAWDSFNYNLNDYMSYAYYSSLHCNYILHIFIPPPDFG